MSISFILAQILIRKLGWTPLSAYGIATTITTTINNAIINPPDFNDNHEIEADRERQKKRERLLDKRRERGTVGKKKK